MYVGGQIKTIEVDPDQLCSFWLKELAGKCGRDKEIEQVMYLVPGLMFEDGLRTVFDDKEVREMAEVASKHKGVDLFVVHMGDKAFGKGMSQPSHTPSNVSPLPKVNRPTNLTPKRVPTGATMRLPDDYQWEDIRPDNPLGWADLLRTDFSSDVDDSESNYIGDYEDESVDSLSSFIKEGFLSDEGVLYDEVFQDEDEEQQNGEEIVGEEVFQLGRQLEQEAGEGRLGLEQQQKIVALSGQLDAGEQGPLSDYEGTDEDIHTPPETDDEESLRQSREERSLLVSENSDWASFKWRAGQRFPTRELFKKAVAKFAIIQGRNLSIVVSNKKKMIRVVYRSN
ncbi:Deoxyuridine 5'-triphosphate nucleotidohydrolase [Bienertia sinuspersici]